MSSCFVVPIHVGEEEHGTCSLLTADAHKLRAFFILPWSARDPKTMQPPRNTMPGALTGAAGPRAH